MIPNRRGIKGKEKKRGKKEGKKEPKYLEKNLPQFRHTAPTVFVKVFRWKIPLI